MVIKMLTTYAGPAGNCLPGGLMNVSEKLGTELIKNGYGVSIENVVPKKSASPVDGDKTLDTDESYQPGRDEPGDESEREKEIYMAVSEIVAAGDAENLTQTGMPKTSAVEALIGYDIKSVERDNAYAKLVASD